MSQHNHGRQFGPQKPYIEPPAQNYSFAAATRQQEPFQPRTSQRPSHPADQLPDNQQAKGAYSELTPPVRSRSDDVACKPNRASFPSASAKPLGIIQPKPILKKAAPLKGEPQEAEFQHHRQHQISATIRTRTDDTGESKAGIFNKTFQQESNSLPNQEVSTPRRAYDDQQYVSPPKSRQLKPQHSMPHPGTQIPSPQSQPIQASAPRQPSRDIGRGADDSAELRYSTNNPPKTYVPRDNAGYSDRRIPSLSSTSPRLVEETDESYGSVGQKVDDVLHSARDIFEAMRIKESWYPKAVQARDNEIERLNTINERLAHDVHKAIDTKTRTIAQATAWSKQVKQKQREESEARVAMDQVAHEKHETVSKLANQAMEEMKDFKEQSIGPIDREVKALTSTFSTLRAALNVVKEEAFKSHRIAEDLAKCQEEIVSLKTAARTKDSHILQLETKLEHYEAAVAPALAKLDGKVADLQKEKGPYAEGIDILIAKNTQLHEQLLVSHSKLNNCQSDLERLRETKDTYENRLEEYADILRQKGCDADDLSSMIDQLESRHQKEIKEVEKRYSKELKDDKFRLEHAAGLIDHLNKDMESMKQQEAAYQTTILEKEGLVTKVDEMKEKLIQMERTIRDTESAKAEVEKQSRESQLRAQEYLSKLSATEEILNDMKKKSRDQEKENLKQYNDNLKAMELSILKKLPITSNNVDEKSTLKKLEDQLRACREELEVKLVEIAELKHKSIEDVPVHRWKNNRPTPGEIELYKLAEENCRSDQKEKEKATSNLIKSLEAQLTKHNKERDEPAKDKQLEEQRQRIQAMSSCTPIVPSDTLDPIPLTSGSHTGLTQSKRVKRRVSVPDESEQDELASPEIKNKKAKLAEASKHLDLTEDEANSRLRRLAASNAPPSPGVAEGSKASGRGKVKAKEKNLERVDDQDEGSTERKEKRSVGSAKKNGDVVDSPSESIGDISTPCTQDATPSSQIRYNKAKPTAAQNNISKQKAYGKKTKNAAKARDGKGDDDEYYGPGM
ncbi:uncharacterized protein IL334_000271 [Kwoniella shivajii]|uniref:Hyaluronan-mediated motility receptor C-terminal domain-containing protein n=1 Tax=Kwoniella shivajii TaxID=564305 RepID=A0ABZ1CRQ5_9TREE|nr:hypothetical protein IL334_000271 [Kwoniella shivajii]